MMLIESFAYKAFVFRFWLIIALVPIYQVTSAQNQAVIKGVILNELSKPVTNATVFIAGSKKATISDSSGIFILTPESGGAYQVSVSIIGYGKVSKTVLLTDSTVFLTFRLKQTYIALAEVIISLDDDKERNLKTFKKEFLGISRNARQCIIRNPERIVLSMDKKTGVLSANSEEFIEIENRALGYLVKYSLKNFSFDSNKHVTLYDGDIIFEDLISTQNQKDDWKVSRQKAYKNSLMQFLRALYNDNLVNSDYTIHRAFDDIEKKSGWGFGKYVVEVNPAILSLESLNATRQPDLLNLKFVKILISYHDNHTKTAKVANNHAERDEIIVNEDDSIIYLLKPNLIIDRRGDYSDHSSLYITGKFAQKRVADQLPYEYQP